MREGKATTFDVVVLTGVPTRTLLSWDNKAREANALRGAGEPVPRRLVRFLNYPVAERLDDYHRTRVWTAEQVWQIQQFARPKYTWTDCLQNPRMALWFVDHIITLEGWFVGPTGRFPDGPWVQAARKLVEAATEQFAV